LAYLFALVLLTHRPHLYFFIVNRDLFVQ
jgi:hypothetical protein